MADEGDGAGRMAGTGGAAPVKPSELAGVRFRSRPRVHPLRLADGRGDVPSQRIQAAVLDKRTLNQKCPGSDAFISPGCSHSRGCLLCLARKVFFP